jgi:hypothetical protein
MFVPGAPCTAGCVAGSPHEWLVLGFRGRGQRARLRVVRCVDRLGSTEFLV